MSHTKRRTFSLSVLAGLSLIAAQAGADEALNPVDQLHLNRLVAEGRTAEAFSLAFEMGDELTEFDFTSDHGVGANIGGGQRFSRFPRADLNGPGEWATHFPAREGGANATSCISCHSSPIANGAGSAAVNIVLDPGHTGDPSQYLVRNTTHVLAMAIPQRLAEEMTQALFAQRADAEQSACQTGAASAAMTAKGVSFGTLTLTRTGDTPCRLHTDTSGLEGIDDDLIVKPFGWKGNEATLRAFTRNAAHNELGMQGTELVGEVDGDFDGVTGELSVGDMTALTIYMAALERPVSMTELADLGLVDLTPEERRTIDAGRARFDAAGCGGCHRPSMVLDDPIFREPARVPGHFDTRFPDGSDPAAHGLRADLAVSFDMRTDPPNNRIQADGGGIYHLGAPRTDDQGRVVAEWFTDFKRHDMGPELADPAAPLGIGARMFLTRSLAGVGSTGPWLHDGRATTLAEAVLAHGGAAAASRDAFAAMNPEAQAELVAFLDNLVIHTEEDAAH